MPSGDESDGTRVVPFLPGAEDKRSGKRKKTSFTRIKEATSSPETEKNFGSSESDENEG